MDMTLSLDVLGSYVWLVIPSGLLLGLLGYRLYKISLFVIVLYLGLALGSWIGESMENLQLGLILGIVLGLALGVVTQFLIRFSLFIAGMAGGLIVASLILPGTSVASGSTEYLAWSGGTAVVGGLLALRLYKTLILLITSLVGAYMIYLGTVDLFPAEASKWSWILYVVLFLVFIITQAGTRKEHDDPVERARERKRHYT